MDCIKCKKNKGYHYYCLCCSRDTHKYCYDCVPEKKYYEIDCSGINCYNCNNCNGTSEIIYYYVCPCPFCPDNNFHIFCINCWHGVKNRDLSKMNYYWEI